MKYNSLKMMIDRVRYTLSRYEIELSEDEDCQDAEYIEFLDNLINSWTMLQFIVGIAFF